MKNWIGKHARFIMIFSEAAPTVAAYIFGAFGWWLNTIEFPLSARALWSICWRLGLYCVVITSVILWFFYHKVNFEYEENNKKLLSIKKQMDLILNQIQKCMDSILYQSSVNLNLASEHLKEDRLTIFGLRNDTFFALSRYSENPLFKSIHSGKKYFLNKGCIAHGYINGWHIEKGLNVPDYSEDKEGYKKYFKSMYQLQNSDIRDLSMKSKYYAVKRIQKPGHPPLGVVVFESLRANRFEEEIIQKELTNIAETVYDFLTILDMKAEQLSDEVRIELDDK